MRLRKLRTAEEFHGAEEFQKRIWRFPEREIVPLNELVVLQKHGGCVFGAFERGRLVSLCYGQPAFARGKTYHYSRLLGVLPSFRDRGLGRRMKLQQRAYVLEQGLDLIRWTFDPLQGRNALLNIARLGCVAREYLVDVYPTSESQFNLGLGSDRFVPEWWIRSAHVRRVLAGKRPPPPDRAEPAIETSIDRHGWLDPRRVRRPKGRHVTLDIPWSIDALKKASPPLAKRWRSATRKAFLDLFARGYVVHHYQGVKEDGRRRGRYYLEKGFRVR